MHVTTWANFRNTANTESQTWKAQCCCMTVIRLCVILEKAELNHSVTEIKSATVAWSTLSSGK